MALVNNSVNYNAVSPAPVLAGGTGLSNPTDHAILLGSGATALTPVLLTDGQLLVGSTGVDPVAASLTAGSGIVITPGAGTISIAAIGGSDAIVDQISGSVTMAVNTVYMSNFGASLVTFTLPTGALQGEFVEIVGQAAGLFSIAQAAGQRIFFGNASSTAGAGGSMASSLQYDAVKLRAITGGPASTWQVVSAVGNFNLV